MTRKLLALALAPTLFFATPAFSVDPAPAPIADKKEAKPRVEVCFVLDTTGSMSGLIEGAKAKIWSIANQVIKRKPTPEVRIGLIAYRDRGDEYITKRFDLTDDIDAVFKNLTSFKADGGGDEPESVNQALDEAVNKITWSADKSVLKVIFLVGDAPPHMDYKDDKKYPDICKEAAKKDLIINTVQCGTIAATGPIWQEIAKASEGEYAAIEQGGNMAVVSAPQDVEIAKLNAAIGKTLVPCATNGRKWEDASKEVASKQAAAEAAPASVAADRLVYNAESKRAVQVAGLGDGTSSTTTFSGAPDFSLNGGAFRGGEIELIDGITNGTLKLADMKDEQLPPEMRKMTLEQRQACVTEKQKERAGIQAKIAELSKARDAYILDEQKKLTAASAAKKDSFDAKVAETINKQADAKKR